MTEKFINISTQSSSPPGAGELDFLGAAQRLTGIVAQTPLQFNQNLSQKYQCNVFLKREDLQLVRSYKLRGAYNMMRQLPAEQLQKGVVCASAGNHAQGFAYSCKKLGIKGVIFMPFITPKQKINQTKMFGGDFVDIRLIGDTFDDCAIAAKNYTEANKMVFIPPFDDVKIIEGQATVGVEIINQFNKIANPPSSTIDYLFMPIGGGGLSAGVGSYFKQTSPTTTIVGVEPSGAPSMLAAFKSGQPVTLNNIDRFVDGAAVKRVGSITYPICANVLNEIQLVEEGKICSTIIQLYNQDAIVAEPAGALSIAALDYYKDVIINKTIVCVVSGGNNDIDRMPEIKERSLQYEGLKHYFLIQFAQRAGALKEFVNHVLGETDDITRFEYLQKTNKETGPALVGIELNQKSDYEQLIKQLQKHKINYSEITNNELLYSYLL